MISAAGRAKLATCDPRLVEIVTAVAEVIPLVVVCGHREQREQDLAVARGASKVSWPNSRHNTEPSLAVDLAPLDETGAIDWDDREAFAYLAGAVVYAGALRGVEVTWGGHWRNFPDSPHFQVEPEG